MCMSSSPAQAAPDPYATAQAQAQANEQVAQQTAQLDRYNQNTPYGSLNWTQPTNADGSANPNGTWTQDVTLSPQQQQILDQNQSASLGLGTAINNSLDAVTQNSLSPVTAPDYSDDGFNSQTQNQVAGQLYGQYSSLYKPQQQQATQQLQDQLQAQGLAPGSQAYQTASDNLSRQQASQDQQAMSTAETQATGQANAQSQQDMAAKTAGFQAQTGTQNQLLNALASLRNGSQVSNPSFSGESTGTQVAQTPLSQDVYSSYNGSLQQQQLDNNSASGLMSGIGSLGGAGASLYTAFSDRRLKSNVKRVGRHKTGLPLYRYNYTWETKPRLGLMADEVAVRFPAAVYLDHSGFYKVDYAQLGGL